MNSYATLDINVGDSGPDQYSVFLDLAYSSNEANNETNVGQEQRLLLPRTNFDRQRFLPLLDDHEAYGVLLGESILAQPETRDRFVEARTIASQMGVKLRVRLKISPDLAELHNFRWELMCDPVERTPLFLSDHILFSRYLYSADVRPVRLSTRSRLRALVVIANPRNLQSKYGLAPIDVEEERDRASKALQDVDVAVLDGVTGPATLDNILDEMRAPKDDDEEIDILYLVCHGAFSQKGEPKLWLEDDYHDAVVMPGSALANRLADIERRPRLLVLASCQSAGLGHDARFSDQNAMTAIGPVLARRAVPAVVAMQGNLTMETAGLFFPVFFKTLQDEGLVDLAMNRARTAVIDQKRPDSWMPVLFLRLNAGRLLARPSARSPATAEDAFSGWPGLCGHIAKGRCTPVLGPCLSEHLFGSHREIARAWAKSFRYPMAQYQEEELTNVAQFVSVTQGSEATENELTNYLRGELLKRFKGRVPDLPEQADLLELMRDVGRWAREQDPLEPHLILAKLNCPLYITTNWDPMLADALREEGDEPEVGVFDWQRTASTPDPRFSKEAQYWPTRERPLVYHLFGRLQSAAESGHDWQGIIPLVLSQDDYFEYLISMSRNKELMPSVVNQALGHSALMFIGFQLNDWCFRVLLQSIRDRGGSSGNDRFRFQHVAVQIDPQEGQLQDPEMARRYLKKMGQIIKNVDIYWGSVGDFMRELQKRLPQSPAAPSPKLVGAQR